MPRVRGGLPHSDTPGSKPARGSPGLVAACRVLHRLSAPRHPPGALLSLAPPRRPRRRGRAPRPLSKPTNNDKRNTTGTARVAAPGARHTPHVALLLLPHARARVARAHVVSPPHDRKERPPPPPRRRRSALVGPGRLERPTSRLSGARSDLLSYGPGPGRGSGGGGSRGGRDARTARPAPGGAPRPRPPAAVASMVDRPPRRARRPQKGGDPAAGSPTATLLRLHPSRKPDRGRPPPIAGLASRLRVEPTPMV